MKKQRLPLVILSFLIVMSLFLASCAAPATPTAAPAATGVAATEPAATEAPAGEPVEITFWHTFNTDSPEVQTLDNILIPAFEAAHPNIKVSAIQVPWADFLKKLTSALAAGTAPDLIRSDIVWVPELAEMGAFVALDEAMPDFADYKAQVFPGPLSTNLWQGHYYGLPLDTNTKVWVYNDAMYSAAGIDGAPATLE